MSEILIYAADFFGLNAGNIHNVLSGRQNKTGGKVFKYVEDVCV